MLGTSATSSHSPITLSALNNRVTYTCTVSARNVVGIGKASSAVTITPSSIVASNFSGNSVLGEPTATSIKANVFSPEQSGTVSISYGTASGDYSKQTSNINLIAKTPLELTLDGLSSDTQYYYRLVYRTASKSAPISTDEYTFHTARPSGSTFTFTIQGNSHPERPNEFSASLYSRTLQTAAADKPDFYLTLGDDFSVGTLPTGTETAALVTERYTLQRPYLGLIGRTTPVFLVNGNHEQSAGDVDMRRSNQKFIHAHSSISKTVEENCTTLLRENINKFGEEKGGTKQRMREFFALRYRVYFDKIKLNAHGFIDQESTQKGALNSI